MLTVRFTRGQSGGSAVGRGLGIDLWDPWEKVYELRGQSQDRIYTVQAGHGIPDPSMILAADKID
ncbi:MAG: hypothetical protein P9L99_04440 [Candidatus Lernaella stagnicola]|nr:hypothetical protein [Candidatus Lernaella stagnicola]